MIKLVTYSTLTRALGKDEAYVQVREAVLHDILRSALASIEVDEVWYRKTYQDIDDAIKAGRIDNAQEHYIGSGYFEGRQPREFIVDTAWYLKAYGDVADAVSRGKLESAQEHFEMEGFKEGRIPYEGWSL